MEPQGKVMSPSQYAKSIGWRSLKDCERFLGLGENSIGRTAKSNPVKFRAMVRGAWLEYCERKEV